MFNEKIIKKTKKYCFKDSEKINKELTKSRAGTQEKIGRKNRKIFIKQQSRITPQCYNCKYLFVDFDQIRIFHAILLSFMQIFYAT